MSILYLIIPLLIGFLGLIGYTLWWSNRKGLFNDLQGPQHWCKEPYEDRECVASAISPKEQNSAYN